MMQIKSRVYFITLLIMTCNVFAFSQQTLKEQLQGKTTLAEIMQVVDTYYAQHPEDENEFESDYLHWKRWEWYMSGRLGHGGQFVNISEKLIDGLKEKEKMPVPKERNINSEWTFMGPSTTPLQNEDALYNGIGRVDRIVFHPTNPNIFFICTPAGGLWGTLNGGTSWNNLTDNLPSIGISGFVITPSNTSIMYLLTGDGDSNVDLGFVNNFGYMRPSIGVLKSTDGGVSWHQTGAFPEISGGFVGYKLIQHPADPDILLAGTSDGLFRTTNGGDTWVKELNLTTYDIEFKPGDPNRVYASVKGDFWISTNAGSSWTSNSTYDFNPNACGSEGGGRIQIAVAPSSSSKVYLLSGPQTGFGFFCGLWLSTDSGASFARQSNSPNVFGSTDSGVDSVDQSIYDNALACRTDLSTGIVAGGCTVWRSTNGGAGWVHSTSYGEDGNFPYIHPDVHDLVYNPLNNWLYAATDGGLYRSQDHGVTWTDLSPNIETSQFYHMRGWDGNLNKLIGGLQDNGVKYRLSNSSAFYHLGGGDGFDIVLNPDTGEPAYGTINAGVRRYENDGATSVVISPGGYPHFFKTLAIHNTDPDIVFLGSFDILKSTNAGESWSNKNASGSWAMTSCPSNSTRFYAAGGTDYNNGSGGLYFSDDSGETWTDKSDTPGFPDEDNWIKITDVAVRPTNSSHVWACFGGFDAGYKVVWSSITGDSWANRTYNLPNVPVNCLAIDSDNGCYAGTDIGVFYLAPTTDQWMPWSNGLPNVPVTDLVIFDDGTTKRIRASTFGRGVWQSNLAQTCDPSVIVTGGLEGIRHYEATTSISSSSVVQGGIGTFVSFQSGNYITLTENFRVIDDSEFLGFISPCGQGGIPSAHGSDIPINRNDPNSSVILLRRMWDPDDERPYGAIDDIQINGNAAVIDFTIKKSGKVILYVAREIQDKLIAVYNSETDAGEHEVKTNLTNLPKEFHYLLLFYEGKLAHYLEFDLR